MQTFLPYRSVEKSLKCLDSKRLGKQRIEAFQILNILLRRTCTGGWKNHPAVNMWRGYENALKFYFNKSLEEWISRGYRNNMKKEVIRGRVIFPKWFNSRKLHASHRGNLLRKDRKYYSRFGWKESSKLPYFWPVRHD